MTLLLWFDHRGTMPLMIKPWASAFSIMWQLLPDLASANSISTAFLSLILMSIMAMGHRMLFLLSPKSSISPRTSTPFIPGQEGWMRLVLVEEKAPRLTFPWPLAGATRNTWELLMRSWSR